LGMLFPGFIKAGSSLALLKSRNLDFKRAKEVLGGGVLCFGHASR
jgi:hypothetical protein